MTQPTAAFGPTPPLLVISRFRVPAPDRPAFYSQAEAALEILAAASGCRTAALGQSTDDADLVVLRTEWDGVGAYRRALGSYEAKVTVVPLLSRAVDEPSAFELTVLVDAGSTTSFRPGLAADAGDVRLGEASRSHVRAVGEDGDR